jgi:hypothetical protein
LSPLTSEHKTKGDETAGAKEMQNAYAILTGTPTGEDQIEDTSVTQTIILKWIPEKHFGKLCNGIIRRKTGTIVELL